MCAEILFTHGAAHVDTPKNRRIRKKYIQVKAFSTDSIDLVDGSCPPSFRLLLIYIYIYIYKCFFSLSLSLFSLASFTRKSLWATLGPASDLSSSYCLPVVLFFFFSSFFFFSLFFSFVGEYQKNIYIYQHLSILYLGLLLRETGKERRLCDK